MTTMLVTNGPIYTLDPAKPLVEALGIRDLGLVSCNAQEVAAQGQLLRDLRLEELDLLVEVLLVV